MMRKLTMEPMLNMLVKSPSQLGSLTQLPKYTCQASICCEVLMSELRGVSVRPVGGRQPEGSRH